MNLEIINIVSTKVEIKEEYGRQYEEIIRFNTKRHLMDTESLCVLKESMRNNTKTMLITECGSWEVACNILIDICYTNNKSKDMLWEFCSEQLIKNLINNGYNKIHFPIKAEDGDLEFKGDKFKMEEVDANGINWE